MRSASVLAAVCLVAAVLAYPAPAQADLLIPTALVNNRGNPDDDATGDGGVAYPFEISQYEVTVGQYVQFLNAVAASDPNGLFDIKSDAYTTITRTGAAGSYAYQAVPGAANYPVTRVSWLDAARFVNWLNNGQLPDAQSTENGTYDMSLGANASRQIGAVWALPTTDEWYKAAYYDPTLGDGDYWLYPDRADTAPAAAAPGGAGKAANYAGAVGTYCDVGSYPTTLSYYGLYDMAGNAGEWIEEQVGAMHVIRGGSFDGALKGAAPLESTYTAAGLSTSNYRDVGFRVVYLAVGSGYEETPEPATLALLACGGLGVFAARRRRRRAR